MLIRLLDAFVWKNQDNAEEGRMAFGYVQGMNVLAAPFLYIMPSEIEAFYTFSKFIEQCCPLYVQPTLDGVHRGLTVSKFPQHVICAVPTLASYWTVASKS
jgi:cell cycle arrest protein BUB2